MILRMTRWVTRHCRRQQDKLKTTLPVRKTIRKNKKILLCSSLLILAFALTFLGITFISLRTTMFSNLLQQAERHRDQFTLNLKMAYTSMLQMSTLITSSSDLRAMLLREQQTEGGQKQNTNAEQTISKPKNRNKGLRKTYQFGSLLERKTYMLSANQQRYTWLRGISPLWAVDPATHGKVYVGALEISTTFKDIVKLYAKMFHIHAAVLLNKEYVRNKMWNAATKAYFEQHPEVNHYVEVTTSIELLNKIVTEVFINNDYTTDTVKILYEDGIYYSVYYFPLPDNEEQNVDQPGFMLVWEDVTEQVFQYANNFFINIGWAILAFVLIEIGLIWLLNRETRLTAAEQCAAVDELTGLFNRRYLDDILDNEMHRIKRSQDAPLSLIICDVDHFKRYNDTYGHKAGDECLQKISEALRRQARRSSDCVARYGGEEFVIVLPRTDIHAAIDLAESARKAVSSLNIPHASSGVVPVVTVTLGVACTSHLAEYENVFEAADKNLYIAKNNGRNRVEPLKKKLFHPVESTNH